MTPATKGDRNDCRKVVITITLLICHQAKVKNHLLFLKNKVAIGDFKITIDFIIYLFNKYCYSIIGLYTTFVFLASRLLRGFFSGIYTKIMFDDLPNVDRVLQLCLDIYLVIYTLSFYVTEDKQEGQWRLLVETSFSFIFIKCNLNLYSQVREALELALEEDLFAKLVFLYRSPETMIKWSRPKEEEERPPPER